MISPKKINRASKTLNIPTYVSLYVSVFVYCYMKMKQYGRKYAGLSKWVTARQGI